MITVSRNVFIKAPVERVFALMANPAARSALSPHAQPLQVEIEGGESLRQGSVCHFRLKMDNRIAEYRTRVCEFSPNQLISTISDTPVPFQIRVETRPEGRGTWLTQTEQFDPTEDMLSEALPPTIKNIVMEKIYWLLPFLDLDYATRTRRDREDRLEQQLGEKLEHWLVAIQQHLESGNR
ncbi:MAG TPA: SRPBCC family protein [Sulfuricaulis sp.]